MRAWYPLGGDIGEKELEDMKRTCATPLHKNYSRYHPCEVKVKEMITNFNAGLRRLEEMCAKEDTESEVGRGKRIKTKKNYNVGNDSDIDTDGSDPNDLEYQRQRSTETSESEREDDSPKKPSKRRSRKKTAKRPGVFTPQKSAEEKKKRRGGRSPINKPPTTSRSKDQESAKRSLSLSLGPVPKPSSSEGAVNGNFKSANLYGRWHFLSYMFSNSKV